MNIPNLPATDAWITKNEKGHYDFHPHIKSVLQQLFNELQTNVSNEGYKVPQQPTATITQLNTAQSKGALLYDSEQNKLFVNENGTFKEVLTA